jgi:hypothetical protein
LTPSSVLGPCSPKYYGKHIIYSSLLNASFSPHYEKRTIEYHRLWTLLKLFHSFPNIVIRLRDALKIYILSNIWNKFNNLLLLADEEGGVGDELTGFSFKVIYYILQSLFRTHVDQRICIYLLERRRRFFSRHTQRLAKITDK